MPIHNQMRTRKTHNSHHSKIGGSTQNYYDKKIEKSLRGSVILGITTSDGFTLGLGLEDLDPSFMD